MIFKLSLDCQYTKLIYIIILYYRLGPRRRSFEASHAASFTPHKLRACTSGGRQTGLDKRGSSKMSMIHVAMFYG